MTACLKAWARPSARVPSKGISLTRGRCAALFSTARGKPCEPRSIGSAESECAHDADCPEKLAQTPCRGPGSSRPPPSGPAAPAYASDPSSSSVSVIELPLTSFPFVLTAFLVASLSLLALCASLEVIFAPGISFSLGTPFVTTFAGVYQFSQQGHHAVNSCNHCQGSLVCL